MLAEERTTPETTDVEVAIDVQRLDVKLGDGVAIDVTWVARWTDARPIHTGRSVARAPVAPGGSYDALVAACAQALATLSSDIARSVRAEYHLAPVSVSILRLGRRRAAALCALGQW